MHARWPAKEIGRRIEACGRLMLNIRNFALTIGMGRSIAVKNHVDLAQEPA
jgi:hypothetical protein